MDLKAWREKRTTTMTLPSGLDVTLRKVDFLTLVANGTVPNDMIGALMDLDGADLGDMAVLTQLPHYVKLFDAIVSAALVEPAIGERADETHITLDEIGLQDKITIFSWVMSDTKALAAKFRPNAGNSGDPVEAA